MVGHPRNMDGSRGESARRAETFAASLEKAAALPVVLWDERMTTVSAMGAMSLKIGQALWLGLYFGLKGLKKVIAVKGRRGTKDKERKAV